MSVTGRSIKLVVAIFALGFSGAAQAQESLDAGKSGAQLFASDCVICHKSPQGLTKSGGLFGLDSFLREHYTASRESAGAIAAYLNAVDRAAGPSDRGRAKRGEGKSESKGKKSGSKSSDKKSDDTKSGDTKSGDTKPGDSKSGDSKSGDSKPSDSKPTEDKPKPAETKSETKPPESKPAESKPAETPKSD